MKKEGSVIKKRKKYEPKGLTILFEDKEIIVVNKVHYLLTVATDREKERTVHFLLNEYVKKGNSKSRNRVFIVHRLDRETSGVLVFAKNEKAKRFLQDEWKSFTKRYYAVVSGKVTEKERVITSFLLENKAHRVYSLKDSKKGKFAKTAYRTLKRSERYSLLEVELLTGRKNQIRVHLSDVGNPIAGDKVYGDKYQKIERLCLHSAFLKITHPVTKKEMVFQTIIPPYFSTLFKRKEV